MIPRYSLTTVKQLELSTSNYLLPFFSNFTNSTSPSISINSNASTSKVTLEHLAEKDLKTFGRSYGKESSWKEGSKNKSILNISSRKNSNLLSSATFSSSSKQSVNQVGSARRGFSRCFSTATIDDLTYSEVKEKKLKKREFKNNKSSFTYDYQEDKDINGDSNKEKELDSAVVSTTSIDSPTISSSSNSSIIESSTPSVRTSSYLLPLFPSNLTRSELMTLLAAIPPSASKNYLLRVRSIIIDSKRLDDAGPVILFVNTCIRRRQKSLALRFMKEAAKSRIKSKLTCVDFYYSPIRVLSRDEDWEGVRNFSLAALLVDKSLRVIKARMRSLYETKKFINVISTFEMFLESNELPDGDCYDDLLGAYMMLGNLQAAQDTLARKQELGFPTTVKTCIALLDGMWSFGGNRIMEEKVLKDVLRDTIKKQKALRQDVKVLNRIMSVRAARGDIEDALAVLQFYQLLHLPSKLSTLIPRPPPSTSSTSTSSSSSLSSLSTSSFTSNSNPQRSRFNNSSNQQQQPIVQNRLTISNKGKKPKPDLATFVTLISITLRLELYETAIELFLQSQKLNLGLNEHIIAALVKTCIVSDPENGLIQAEELAYALPKGGAKIPNSTQIVKGNFEPSSTVYEVLLDAVLEKDGLKGACEFFNRMMLNRKRTIEVTEGMIDMLVNYISLNRLQPTKISAGFVVKIQALTHGARKPTIRNLNAMLEAVWRRDRFMKVGGRRKQIKKKIPFLASTDSITPLTIETASQPTATSLQMNSSTSNFLTTATLLPRAETPMTRIRKSLSDRGIVNDRFTTQQVLRNDKAFKTIEAMWEYLESETTEKGSQVIHQHLAIMIRSYIRLGDLDGAKSVLVKARSMGITLTVSLYSVLITGASKLGYPEIANELYREMRRENIQPDKPLFASLAGELAKFGNVEGVDQLRTEASIRLEIPISNIDPIFSLIRYRALVTSGKFLAAQVYMKKCLKEGLKPDLAILRSLGTTIKWLERKLRQLKIKSTKVRTRTLEKTLLKAKQNFNKARLPLIKLDKSEVGKLKDVEGILKESFEE